MATPVATSASRCPMRYRQLRTHRLRLIKAVKLTPYAREELDLARHPESNGEKVTDLERARRFFVSAMMAINGAFGANQGGFSFTNAYSRNGCEARVSRWKKMPSHLDKVAERLRDVRVERKDALVLFEDFARRPATLVYVDPPYLGERSAAYAFDANEKAFHVNLLKALNSAKCMIFISGYANELYDMYLSKQAGWERLEFVAHTKGRDGKKHERKEIVWMNAVFVKARDTKTIPITLTKMEKANKKLNPTR